MLFNSYDFIFIFLPLTLSIFYLLSFFSPGKWPWMWVFGCSLFFYGHWNPTFLPLILCSIAVNYLLSKILLTSQSENRRAWCGGGIGLNLAVIGYFKYKNFFLENLGTLAGYTPELDSIFIPLGISFFTFQQITFLIEAYRREITPDTLRVFPLYISYFPQLIAGPIVLSKEFIPQLNGFKWRENLPEKISVGLSIFMIGLFKKTVIADGISVYVVDLFNVTSYNGGTAVSFFSAWEGVLSYTFQLYFDFSGYSDMAVGLAALFGIKIPQNFNSPYKAVNISDFWRRWHITLSRFLKDYLYIPLGGNRGGPVGTHFNLLITMILGGLWHGAQWTFVIWGLYHGLLLICRSLWSKLISRLSLKPENNYFYMRFSQGLTFLVVIIGWVIFRSSDMDQATSIIQSMFSIPTLDGADPVVWIFLLSLFGVTSFAPNLYELFGDWSSFNLMTVRRQQTLQWKPRPVYAVLVAVIGVFAIISINADSEFLYFQF